jgi:hypothetical protein
MPVRLDWQDAAMMVAAENMTTSRKDGLATGTKHGSTGTLTIYRNPARASIWRTSIVVQCFDKKMGGFCALFAYFTDESHVQDCAGESGVWQTSL